MEKVAKLTDEQLSEMKEAFHLFDKDGDGKIAPKELELVMRSLGYYPSQEELEFDINYLPKDENGNIEFEEFAKIMVEKLNFSNPVDELSRAFAVFDRDGTGYIDAQYLYEVMTTLGDKLTDEEAKQMIKEADVFGNGQIPYEDFVYRMSKYLRDK